MNEPTYHLQSVLKNSTQDPADFSGPLDVILLLLGKNKIEIRDIKISVILEQYMEYLDEMKLMYMEIASEFITMASQLVLIKTKMLLSEAEKQEGLSEMELLMQALEQRQRQEIMAKLRSSISQLEQKNERYSGYFTKNPEPIRRELCYNYQHDALDLKTIWVTLQEREFTARPSVDSTFAGIVGKEPYPVEKKSAEILRALIRQGALRLKSLFHGNCSRSEVVATFLSILELCKLHSVSLTEQHGDYTVGFLKMPDEGEVQD